MGLQLRENGMMQTPQHENSRSLVQRPAILMPQSEKKHGWGFLGKEGESEKSGEEREVQY
jgi:hypothetical protein